MSSNKDIEKLNSEIEKIEADMASGLLEKADLWWSVENAMTISFLVLLFGVFVISVAARLISKGSDTDSVLKVFALILIIVSAVFLVVAGYSDQQISPVIGLLGTIAGYLLGKDHKGQS